MYSLCLICLTGDESSIGEFQQKGHCTHIMQFTGECTAVFASAVVLKSKTLLNCETREKIF